jgi:DNA-binding CsgD family transcriptional regulator
MNTKPYPLGTYSKAFLTNVPANLTSKEANYYRQTIPKFPEEAIYVYSFKEGRMIYANGWEEVAGRKDGSITMLDVVNMSAPSHANFVHEINDKALMFIHNKTKDFEHYSFSIELKIVHTNGSEVPVIARVACFDSEDGKLTAIIGRFQINRNLIFGKVMRYAAFGPDKEEFEEELNRNLFYNYAISDKEKQALALLAEGYSFKEIASNLNVSPSAIEKRIVPMYKRFNVNGVTHLVSFAYENYILP